MHSNFQVQLQIPEQIKVRALTVIAECYSFSVLQVIVLMEKKSLKSKFSYRANQIVLQEHFSAFIFHSIFQSLPGRENIPVFL